MQDEASQKLDPQCLEALTTAHRKESPGTGLRDLARAVNDPVVSNPKEAFV
jgi:hypothetical protein